MVSRVAARPKRWVATSQSDLEGTMPANLFGMVDVVIGGIIALLIIIAILVEIPDLTRYMKIKSM